MSRQNVKHNLSLHTVKRIKNKNNKGSLVNNNLEITPTINNVPTSGFSFRLLRISSNCFLEKEAPSTGYKFSSIKKQSKLVFRLRWTIFHIFWGGSGWKIFLTFPLQSSVLGRQKIKDNWKINHGINQLYIFLNWNRVRDKYYHYIERHM